MAREEAAVAAAVTHKRDCSKKTSRYGDGDPTCTACVARAEKIKATGCTYDPFAMNCGNDWAPRGSVSAPCGNCGRSGSTD